jgi:hypothetical protein
MGIEKGGENTAFNILTISYEKPIANIEQRLHVSSAV